MSISGTYGGMQAQIADELGDRQDLLLPIAGSTVALGPILNAIQSAIAKWERSQFYFNQLYDTVGFSTSAGQEFYGANTNPVSYALLATSPHIQQAHVLVSGNRYTFNVRTPSYLEDTSVNPSVVGQPVDMSYFAEQLRFYPIPDAAYPVTISGTQRFTALVNAPDTNAWMQDGWDLIKSAAKLILAQEVLYDDNLATAMKKAIYGDPAVPEDPGYLYDLRGETARRMPSGGRIRPSHF